MRGIRSVDILSTRVERISALHLPTSPNIPSPDSLSLLQKSRMKPLILAAPGQQPASLRVLRTLVLLGSGILLFHALIHGPGRGMTLIAANDHLHAGIRLLSYGAFLLGSSLCVRRPRMAAVVLLVGLVARAELELTHSVAKLVFGTRGGPPPAEFAAVFAFYLLSWVLPTLLAIDCYRTGRGRERRVV